MSACSGTHGAAVWVKCSLSVPDRAGPGAGFMIMSSAFELDHMDDGIDQRQVSEGLREVAQMLAGVRVDLFAV